MRYRPRSSVTTIFANLVGRSLVSAITQTPASGPFALVTTPARSLPLARGPDAALCGPPEGAWHAAKRREMPLITSFMRMLLLLAGLWQVSVRAKLDNYAAKTNGGKPELGLPFARGY